MNHRFRPAFFFGLLGYLALTILVVLLFLGALPRNEPTVQVLLPAAPAALLLICVLLVYRRLDEREQRAHQQAFCWAFVATSIAFIVYGIGQVLLAFPDLNLASAGAFMLCMWGAAWLVSARRLR